MQDNFIEGYRLSPQQKRLWLLQATSNKSPYYAYCAIRIQGPLNKESLQCALVDIVQRHEILRTSFQNFPEMTFPLQVIRNDYLSAFTEDADFPNVFQNYRSENIPWVSIEPLLDDLEHGPLFHTKLILLEKDEQLLLIRLPSLCADAAALQLLVKDLSLCYEICLEGLGDLSMPLQYADLAEWQNQLLESEETEAGKYYWRQYWKKVNISNALSPKLPFGNKVYEENNFLPRFFSVIIPTYLVQEVKRCASDYRTEPEVVLLTCWHILLERLTSQKDIVIGTTFDNRKYEELQNSLGIFSKVLPIESPLSEPNDFYEALQLVDETLHKAYDWQEYFSWEIEEDERFKRKNLQPFFPIAFESRSQLQNYYVRDVVFSVGHQYTCSDRFSLKLNHIHTDKSDFIELQYDANSFNQDEIECLANQFLTLLSSATSKPTLSIANLVISDEIENRNWLAKLNDTTLHYPLNKCIHQVFEEQVRQKPNEIAIVYNDSYYTYEELNNRANKLARHLQTLGIGPEILVAIYCERSLEMITAIFGILKAGAYVPLDPTYPKSRIAFMLKDAQIPIILTQSKLVSSLPDCSAIIVCVDSDWDMISKQPNENLLAKVEPDNLAYVIYTSGSTGDPKGVMVSHRSPINLLVGLNSFIYDGFNKDSLRVSLNAPLSFDASMQQLLMLLNGYSIYIIPQEIRTDGEALLRYLRDYLIDAFDCTPSQLTLLLEAGLLVDEKKAPSLFLVAGEAINENMWMMLKQSFRINFYNIYGPTECTVDAVACRIQPWTTKPRIGKPLANYRTYVLNDQLSPVPAGITGELYIGGPSLARGYFMRPDLTAERFIPNLFDPEMGTRLYKTGDRVRILPEGTIDFLGRTDNQVKIRGYRIELGEIEVVLKRHPAVQDAVVIVQENEAGSLLIAYIVPREDVQIDSPSTNIQFYDFLRDRLPLYMLPSIFVQIDAIPLTPNGKVDRTALPEPNKLLTKTHSTFVEPRSTDEEILAIIWSQVLGVEHVGIDDNYFALGGDSIRSIQVQSLAHSKGFDFSLQDLFRNQTIRELVQARSGKEGEALTKARDSFSLISSQDREKLPEDVDDAYPLTMLQAGMIFRSEYNLDLPIFLDVFSIRFHAALDTDALMSALQKLPERHPVLRTSFDFTNYSEPLQLVHHLVNLPVQIDDLRNFSYSEQEQIIEALIEKEKKHHFDWTSAPLVRFQVCRLTDDIFQFIFTEHQAILDGWSVASLLTELFHYYSFLTEKEHEPVGPAPLITFREAVALEKEIINSPSAATYWNQFLHNYPSQLIHPWFPSDQSDSTPLHIVVEVPISEYISETLQRLAKSASVPVKSVMLAAHLKVMSLLSGESDAVTGLIFNIRPETFDGDRVLGQFLNAVPFRLNLLKGSWLELIKTVLRAELELLPFRRYPITQLQRTSGQNLLFETAFNFTHFHIYKNIQRWKEIQVLDVSFFEQNDLTLLADFSVDPLTSRLQLTLNCNGLSQEQVQAIQEYYVNVLVMIANDPNEPHSATSLLSSREKKLIVDINSTAQVFPQDKSFIDLFEMQVSQTPNATAVSCEHEHLTYQELNNHADTMAQHLVREGVGPDVIVAVLANRDINFLVAILAIYKAGGVYLPLDPTYPTQRLNQILLESHPHIVLISSEFNNTDSISLIDQILEVRPRVLIIEETIIHKVPSRIQRTSYIPNVLAYVIFTSGSTGVPKGAMIETASMLNHLFAVISDLKLTHTDVFAQTASQCFDISVVQFLAALLVGGRVHIIKDNIVRDPSQFLEEIIAQEVTILELVPSLIAGILEHVATVKPDSYPLSMLRWLISTGEQVQPQVCRMWLQLYPEIPILNAYGPTECADDVTCYEIRDKIPSNLALVPIGRPIANLRCYILDRSMLPVPIGVPGELYVGGLGVGRGYFNDAPQTAKAFVPDPFATEPGGRLYKTGDISRILPDGNLEYLGRVDYQVKVHGFRIELGEIEEMLLRHSAIKEAVVTALSGNSSNNQLIAYIVFYPGNFVQKTELMIFLSERLPTYMVPNIFVTLGDFPRSPNGKVDRNALPSPEFFRGKAEREIDAPRDQLELGLLKIWEDILGITPIGIHDNFFEIGGDSLQAVRITTRLRQHFGKNVPLAHLIQAPTIEKQASYLRILDKPVVTSSLVALQQKGTNQPFFCIHPSGGNVFCYTDFAQCLGEEQPFYGIQAVGLSGEKDPYSTVEEMAAFYINEIRSLQSDAPYFLGGWSFGGTVAFEMARQLHQQGFEVALLAIIDADARIADRLSSVTGIKLLGMFSDDLGLPIIKPNLKLEDISKSESDLLFKLLYQAKKVGVVNSDLDISQFQYLFDVYKANVQALQQYIPRPYAGSIFLFSSAEQKDINGDPLMGWGILAEGGVKVQTISGNHNSIIRLPNVSPMAEQIKMYLTNYRKISSKRV